MKVLIIGAGTGGLALAHLLKQAGVCMAVYERDLAPNTDSGGYRVGISPAGSRALKACIPGELYDLYVATCARSPRYFNMLTEQLGEVLSFDVDDAGPNALDDERNVIRKTLRRVLLRGLEDDVFFGKALQGYSNNADGSVTASFQDGSLATGDVLVGADGTSSAVRRQRLPEARLEDTGIVSLGGKIPMTVETKALLSDKMFKGMSLIMAPMGFGAIIHSLEFADSRSDPGVADRWPDFVEAFDEDSIGWGIWGARQNCPRDPAGLSGEQLRELGLELARDWHPHLRTLIRMTEPSTIRDIKVRTSVPLTPWASSNVTLLGDAVHTMTPGRGAGANTALRDAALLGRMLVEADQGRKPLVEAIHAYEVEMLRYSTEAVQESKKQMDAGDLAHRPVVGRLQLAVMRGVMRIINAMPALKRRAFRQMMRVRGEN
ncbi:NAD(P)/FAD-dependent oxidoreductase [Rhizobium beringeri]|jgi:2-polyprenyl-6-methoxyphenol hydroxylase-like FAD-dependent oxidoreductase|uniref:FAD-dependent oxidoreductase n=1 Tax=Rhizobium TaxID=379 RepID=UPI00102F637C|nr:NAD(P)/FAD-dependent oxidoreductase [Rhizobium leguminosarum]NKL60801.1 FAD-dependent monooxygenase [Rhizobium leguminosarum bv. viciae]TAU52433.1 FAD-dependent monooxygenase [Rhizobium leguminosarum]WSG75643.1 NAD(P)/FAD-dependent oxidoreductase [Rhizobium beringeri]WSH15838.1 NAD(P)/FAD-dependent oxidoreductase [Rhizobium beringeri]